MKILKHTTQKPWGKFCDLALQEKKWHLKILVIKKGERLSLQAHTHRSELWVVAEGRAQVQKGDEISILATKEVIFIEKKEMHRITALTDVVIIELSFGDHKERDIKRFSDDYGRGENK